MQISGKAALVTGGGSGIGKATCETLAAKGVKRLHIADLDEAAANTIAKAAGAKGVEAIPHVVNVGDPAALTALFADAEKRGGLDIVFNNAGRVIGKELFPETSLERLESIVAVNITAVILGTQLAIAMMQKKGGGVVVNTGSMAAFHTRHPDYLYTMSKAAVVSFSQACAPLAATTGVRVNCIMPGLVNTPILLQTGDGQLADYMIPIMANNVALDPSELADAVVGIVEDDARVGELVIVTNQDPSAAHFDESRIRIWAR